MKRVAWQSYFSLATVALSILAFSSCETSGSPGTALDPLAPRTDTYYIGVEELRLYSDAGFTSSTVAVACV